MKAIGLLLLAAAPLSAQRGLAITLGADAGVVRFAHREGADTTATSGAMAGLLTRVAGGPVSLTVRYAESPLDSGRTLADGSVDLAFRLHPLVSLGVGAYALADVTTSTRRWWTWRATAALNVPIAATPLRAVARIGLAPAGSVNDGRDFSGAWQFAAGVLFAAPTVPLTIGLRYRLERVRAAAGSASGPLAEAVEYTGVEVRWSF